MNLENQKGRHVSPMMKVAALVIALAALAFTMTELQSIRDSLTKMRFESQCTDPKVDIEACGQFGIRQIRDAGSEHEMKDGRKLLQQMCEDHQTVACRHIAYCGESWSLNFLTYRNWRDELTQRCEEEGGMACLARAYNEGEGYSSDFFATTAAHCDKHDLDACAAAMAVGRTSPLPTDACNAGLKGACLQGPTVGSAASAATLTDPEFHVEETSTQCANGDADACYKWGVQLVSHNMREWRAAPIAATALEKTFGMACRTGNIRACVQGANAAVDRQIGTPKDTELADEYLKIACGLGDIQACGFRLSIQNLPLDEAREIAKMVCWNTPSDVYASACDSYVAIWMADEGYTPWIMDSQLNTAVLRDTCSTHKDRYSCKLLVENWTGDQEATWPMAFPNRVEAWSAAAVACAKGEPWSCTALIEISKTWPTQTTQSVEELADMICAKAPSMCPTIRDALATNESP